MAIVYSNSSGGISAGVTNTLTWAHTVTAGLQYSILIVGVEFWDDASAKTVNGITYAGQALTLRKRSAFGPNTHHNRIEVWYLLNPPSGLANIVVTMSANAYFKANAVVFSGVDQVTPFSLDAEASGMGIVSPVSTSVTIASVAGELVIDFTGGNNYNNSSPTMIVGAGQTSLYENETNVNYCCIGTSSKPGATSITMTWTFTIIGGEGNWVAVALALRPFIITSARAIKYILDISDGTAILRDDQGAIVDPWDVEPDEWMNVNIPDLPTALETDSFVDDSKKVYIEEIEYDDESGNLAIRNNRGQLLNVLMARLSGGGTI